MSIQAASRREFGDGPLAQVTSAVYCLMTVELLMLLTTLPGLIPLILLDRTASNAPLAVACLLPVAPSLSAALFALRQHRGDLTDLRPAAEFWRGYRLNVVSVLRLWVPWLLGMAVIAENLAHLKASGVPGWWGAALVAIAVASLLWMANALVITSLFSFRTIDVARLSAYFLGRTKGVTLGNLCLLVVAIGVVDLASEAALAALGVAFAGALFRTAEPLIRQVKEEFTA